MPRGRRVSARLRQHRWGPLSWPGWMEDSRVAHALIATALALHACSRVPTNPDTTRGTLAAACGCEDVDRWRGSHPTVYLIKWFNPTADIKSYWLYIRVNSGTLEDTEFTSKNSKKLPTAARETPKLWKILEKFFWGLHRRLEIFEEYKGPDPRSELSSRDLAAHK